LHLAPYLVMLVGENHRRRNPYIRVFGNGHPRSWLDNLQPYYPAHEPVIPFPSYSL
jgi:hypothetical protein